MAEIEKPLAKAIESASCVPKDAGGGSTIWVADVTFKKKTVLVMSAKEGSTFKNKKVVAGCEKGDQGQAGPPRVRHRQARARPLLRVDHGHVPGRREVNDSPWRRAGGPSWFHPA